MTTLVDTPDWLAAWQSANRDKVEAGAKRAAELAAQREAREAQRAARATSTPKRAATPKPPTAPAQRAQAPKAKPAGVKAKLHAPQGFGHDLEEPEAWEWDGGKRREPVLDHNFRPPRIVRQVGWRCCMRCAKRFFSEDVIKVRLCERCRSEQPPW